jgi:DNA processing protein
MHQPVLSRDEELSWLALKLVPGLGTRTAVKLLERFRTPQAVFRASRTELEGAGVSGAVAQSIATGCTFEDAATQREKMAECGAAAVTMGDPRYPAVLREIFDPPILLFARGRIELLQELKLGVVGTRRPTPYGINVSERLSVARRPDDRERDGARHRHGRASRRAGGGAGTPWPSWGAVWT